MIDRNRQAQEHYERGNQFDDAGDAARAIQEWEIAVQLNPNYFDAHYNLAIAYADQGDLARGIYEMNTAHGLEPNDADARRELMEMLLERGDAFNAKKDRDRAIDDWNVALELEPENALIHFKLGQAYKSKFEDAAAEKHLRAAIKANRFFTDAYDQLAEIYVADNRTREAITVLRNALDAFRSYSPAGHLGHWFGSAPKLENQPLDTSVSDLARNLAELELDAGDPDQAMAALEQAEPEKDDAELWRNIAQALEERGDKQNAEIARNRAQEAEAVESVEGESEDEGKTSEADAKVRAADMHYQRGEQLFEQEYLEDAFDAYDKALELNPDHAGAHYGLGLIYQNDEENDLAEKEFREVLRIEPKSADAHFALGEIFDAREDWQNAIQEYRDALRIAPDDPDARERLIWDLLETDVLSEAQDELGRAKLDAEIMAQLWQALGQGWEDRSARGSAIAAYQRAVELDKKLKGAREGLKRLSA